MLDLTIMSKLSVAILFGGKSVEHAISINSAKNIFEFLDKSLFDPILIGISKEGDWFLKNSVDDTFDDQPPLLLNLSSKNKGFKNLVTGEVIKPDVVFPALHGTDGEDGTIQGVLQAFEIPFAGTGVLGSSLSMNKLFSKKLLQKSDIPTSNFVSFTFRNREHIDFNSLKNKLGLPFMAKAANLGSSVGVVKVKSENDLQRATEEAFEFDHTILFEEYIEGRELECSIIGNNPPEASLPAEIVISDQYEFYTYEAKYLDPNAVKLEVPAKVSATTSEKIRDLCIKAYQALNCEDFARVDLFLKENGDILINEINTIPGFTNSSMFPMMWKERGVSFTELITKLLHMAIERHTAKERLNKDYKPT